MSNIVSEEQMPELIAKILTGKLHLLDSTYSVHVEIIINDQDGEPLVKKELSSHDVIHKYGDNFYMGFNGEFIALEDAGA